MSSLGFSIRSPPSPQRRNSLAFYVYQIVRDISKDKENQEEVNMYNRKIDIFNETFTVDLLYYQIFKSMKESSL